MSDAEIIAKADSALAEEFELNQSDLIPEARFKEDLGLDSLDAVDMVVALELAFGIKIGKDPALLEIRTVGDLHRFLIEKKRKIAA